MPQHGSGPSTNGQLMPTNLEQFSICKLHAAFACPRTRDQTARVHRHAKSKLFDVNNIEFAHVDEMTGNRGGCRHDRADEVRAAVFALAPFEVAIAGAGAALMRRQDIGVHADAHTAAGVEPLETGVAKNFVQAFFFRLRFDAAGTGDDQRLFDTFCDVFAFDKMRGGAEIVEPRIGARSDEHAVHRNVHDGRACLEAHVLERAFRGLLVVEVLKVMRVWNALGDARDHAGIRAPSDLRSDLLGVKLDGHIKLGIFVGMQLSPAVDGFLKGFTARDKRTAFHIGEGGFIRSDHAGARAAFDGHVADGHAAVHRKGTNGLAAVFGDVAVAAANADLSDDRENQVLRSDAFGALAVDENVEHLGARLNKTLRCKNVFDFAGADAKGQRAKGAVRGSVAVAANNGLARLSDAELGADDVDNALILAVHVEEADAGLATVSLQGFKLKLGIVIEDRQGAVGGGDRMVHHGESEIRTADFAALRAETGKGLGRSALVDQVAVNVDDRGLAGLFANHVGVPDFLVQRLI